jgi:tripartite-type tricarboxylate transporter receptor subunit TctC
VRPMPSYSVAGALVLFTAAISHATAQETYPVRPVRIIVPVSPGSGTDIVARLMAQGLSERMGRQVVVENRAGAGTIIGSELVAKSRPDGYTLLMGISVLAINPATYKKLPYDALRDFAPITQAVFLPLVMVVHPSVPAKSVKEMIALAKQRPGQIAFASSGLGTIPHLAMELFAHMANVRMIHVPYKGGSGVIDVMAGNVAIMASNMLQALPYARAGRLRMLGVTTARRSPAAPEIPTVAEGGLPGYEAVQWYGLLAPAGTPREIISRLHKESAAVLQTEESRQRLAADGADVVANSPDEFGAFMRTETAKWAKVVRAAGIQPE